MSLINDALRRVKEAHHQPPPPASVGPQFRPVEPVPAPPRKLGLLLPFGLVGVALCALLLVWELAKRNNTTEVIPVRAQAVVQEDSSAKPIAQNAVRASESAAPDRVVSHDPSAVVPSQTAQTSLSNSTPDSTPSAPRVQTSAIVANTGTNAQAGVNPGQNPSTNSEAVAEAQPSKPAPLKLQGIVFSKRPSAVISGKTLFIGDRIREFKLTAITQETATLVSSALTNVLSLSE